ncbi:hypothetical protein ABRY17_06220 [Clostridioides difficile]
MQKDVWLYSWDDEKIDYCCEECKEKIIKLKEREEENENSRRKK